MNWLADWPRRGDAHVFLEGGWMPERVDGMVATGAWYLGIGKLVFLYLKGVKRPSNVLEFRRDRPSRPPS